MSDYKCGLRIVFGRGELRVCEGTIKDVPALIISNEGDGTIGNELGGGTIPSGRELCAFIFENRESFDVLVSQLERLSERFDD